MFFDMVYVNSHIINVNKHQTHYKNCCDSVIFNEKPYPHQIHKKYANSTTNLNLDYSQYNYTKGDVFVTKKKLFSHLQSESNQIF